MRTRTTNKPIGTDSATDFAQQQSSRSNEELQFFNTPTIQVEQTTRGVRFHAKIPPPSISGLRWKEPKELDPSVSVAAGLLVYISPENPLATDGLMDLTTGILQKATPGIWYSAKSVPAQVTVAGTVEYNVPQPLPTAAPTGTPLKGDADSNAIYWIPFAPVLICG